MRNSNIILGIATFTLGVVGAINSIGANRFVANARVWTVGKVVCTLYTTLCTGTTGKCQTGAAANSRTVFTLNSTNCINIHPKA